MSEKYQTIIMYLSDGRQLHAVVPEFCRPGDNLYLYPQFEITESREMPSGYSWAKMETAPVIDSLDVAS
jgi:hypothetical protein